MRSRALLQTSFQRSPGPTAQPGNRPISRRLSSLWDSILPSRLVRVHSHKVAVPTHLRPQWEDHSQSRRSSPGDISNEGQGTLPPKCNPALDDPITRRASTIAINCSRKRLFVLSAPFAELSFGNLHGVPADSLGPTFRKLSSCARGSLASQQ
jgi:hypothetical protein